MLHLIERGRILFILLLASNMTLIGFSQPQTLTWRFIHPLTQEVFTLGTNGSVQQTFLEQGVLPDPFWGENEKLYQWVEDHEWTFKSEFFVTQDQLFKQYVELDFQGVDTYAVISLNGVELGKTANFFLPYSYQVKSLLRVGKNELKLVITPPVIYHRAAYDARTSKLPAPNDVGPIAVASMSRKPQYQFGWDWALRMNTIGLHKPVRLWTYDYNRFDLPAVHTLSASDERAKLSLRMRAQVPTREIVILSDLFGKQVLKRSAEGDYRTEVEITDPTLWWPRGHGDAYCYRDHWKILTHDGTVVDDVSVSFGIRTSELVQEKDQWGTSFYFKINGKPIFAKGANYIPEEVFPSRIDVRKSQRLVEDMHASNFNMVRIWGGGMYASDEFMNWCDSLGIMVWHDFMFACAMYPGDARYLDLVGQELTFQVQRLASHPALVYFNGNNEVDVAWKNWGFQAKYLIGPKMQRQIEADYKALFQVLAPNVVRMHATVPYEHTSPLSNWGKDEYFNHGTMHYWGVWHGKDPMEDFGLKTGRFNAEYGFQSFPEYNTLATFADPSDWELNAPVMKHHQKSYVGNGMIKKHADILYGATSDFRRFVYYSQLTQAKAVGIAVAAHRLNTPRCMGTLVWQLNDCWPAPTWSSIDYNGNWKALQYQMKNDFQDITVLQQIEKLGQERYFMFSEQGGFATTVHYEIRDYAGKLLVEQQNVIQIDASNWRQEIALETQTKSLREGNYVLLVRWTDASGQTHDRSFLHEGSKVSATPASAVKLRLLSVDTIQKTAQLEIETLGILKDCWWYCQHPGVRFQRNFQTLLPGKHLVSIFFDELPAARDFEVIWR